MSPAGRRDLLKKATFGAAAMARATRSSLRFRFLVGLNAAVVVILATFITWDSFHEWRTRVGDKRAAIEDEADALLVAVRQRRTDPEAVQQYIDEVCGRMREISSPGHHIVVELGSQILQARAHHRESERMYRAMRRAAERPDGRAEVDGREIVVAEATYEDTVLYVSEYLSDIAYAIRAHLARRVLSVVVLGAALAIAVSLLVDRMVTRPLGTVVAAVQQLARGGLGVQAPRPKTHELRFLVDEFNAMSSALADAERERQRQMDKARRIQDHIAPSRASDVGIAFSCVYQPAADVTGDYLDIRRADDGTALLCVADVTGHGVPAAMGAAMLKTLFVAASQETRHPQRILSIINEGFAVVCLPEDFASMIVVAIRPDRKTMVYASAGHEAAYLIPQRGEIEALPSTGPLLAIAEAARWDTEERALAPGTRLVMVTDGLAEAMSPAGEMFGRDRVQAAIQAGASGPLTLLCSRLARTVNAFHGPKGQRDDMTILAVEV